MAVEADILCTVDQDLDGLLVVQDHLRLVPVLAFRHLAELDQACGIEQGIGVALQTARVPRQVDEKPAQHLLCMGAGGLLDDLGLAELP